ncbi:MAG: hypothetical protein DSY55_01540 [Clostridia bacterium]|nr:MAG: hypothetical protein DSY55_01540 [Clostridia bacterium]
MWENAPSTGYSQRSTYGLRHKSSKQRYQIFALKKSGHKQAESAQFLNIHQSTIRRELKRNRRERLNRKDDSDGRSGADFTHYMKIAAQQFDPLTHARQAA